MKKANKSNSAVGGRRYKAIQMRPESNLSHSEAKKLGFDGRDIEVGQSVYTDGLPWYHDHSGYRIVRTAGLKSKKTHQILYEKQMTKRSGSMRSNNRAVKQAVRRHIVDSFDDYGATSERAFVNQIDYLLRGDCRSPREAMNKLFEGAVFLFSNSNIVEFLNSIGLDKYTWEEIQGMPDDKAYKAMERAEGLYRNLIVTNGTELYEELKGTGVFETEKGWKK